MKTLRRILMATLLGAGTLATAQNAQAQDFPDLRQETVDRAIDTITALPYSQLIQGCEVVCGQDELRRRVYNIIANGLRSKEVLVDRNYDVPSINSGEEMNLVAQGVILMPGQNYVFGYRDEHGNVKETRIDSEGTIAEFGEGVRLERRGRNLYVNSSEDAPNQIFNGWLAVRRDSSYVEAVRLVGVNFGPEGISEEAYQSLLDQKTTLRERIAEQENLLLERDRTISGLEGRLDRAAEDMEFAVGRLDDAAGLIRDQRRRLGQWDLGPVVSAVMDSNGQTGIEYGLTGTLPGRILLGFTYSTPRTNELPEVFQVTETPLPPDRPLQGMDVRESTTWESHRAYSLKGILGIPVTENLSALIVGGMNNISITTDVKDRFYRVVDGVAFGEVQDEKRFTDKDRAVLFGGGIDYKVPGTPVAAFITGTYSTDNTFAAGAGVRIDFVNATRGRY